MQANVLSQIKLVQITPSLLRVIIKINNWVAGEIDLDKKVFYSTPKTSKNLFFLFDKSEGSIGLNLELLMLSTYDTVKIRYNEKILTCSRMKFLKKGIRSPYCNEKVDAQKCLPLDQINCDENDGIDFIEKPQPNLFEEIKP